MDRCALFVDAGYVLADGAMAVHGTRRRESVSWDYPGLLQLLAGLAMERSRLPLLRCYWYDSTVEGRRSPDHDALADLPGVKLRLAKMRPGRREGVEGEIHRDLTTLARNKAVSDAMVVSGEEDLAQVIADVQDMGMRVTLLHIATDDNAEIPRALRQECDDIVSISAGQLRTFAELISGAEPPRNGDRDGGMPALRAGSNGNGHGSGRPLLGRAAQQPTAQPSAGPGEDRADGVREPAAVPAREYDAVADYGIPADHRPLADYRAAEYSPSLPDYGPSFPDFTPQPGGGRPEFAARAEMQLRQDSQARPELPELRELPARDDLYAAPVAVPMAPEDLPAERSSARPRQEADLLRPVESRYSPGGVRDQFQLDAASREPLAGDVGDRYQPVPVAAPVPAGAAQMRRLPAHNGGPAGQSAGQPSLGQPSVGQPSLGQAQGPGVPVGPDLGAGPSGSGGQPIAPVVPMEQPGLGYGGHRGGTYGGPRQTNGQVSLVGQPAGPSALGGPTGPGDGGSGQPGQPGRPGQAGHAGQQGSDAYPALSQVTAPPSAAQQDAGAPPGYSGGQPGVSLGDAVQSAHEEGQAFGESVARDAPALWLEAVLARKPRMPSDLEARLLQGSALPIDFLLHDEVRHALRRGFWDALEHARR